MSDSENEDHKEVFETKNALTNFELEHFCDKNNLKYHYCELEDLYLDFKSIPNQSFVFTGEKENPYNNGYTHHWLYLFGNYLFDSYSFQNKYKLPSEIKSVLLYPKQLQEFDAVVCGEYCLAFADFIKEDDYEEESIGYDFCNYYGFTKDKEENDEIVYEWYEENK